MSNSDDFRKPITTVLKDSIQFIHQNIAIYGLFYLSLLLSVEILQSLIIYLFPQERYPLIGFLPLLIQAISYGILGVEINALIKNIIQEKKTYRFLNYTASNLIKVLLFCLLIFVITSITLFIKIFINEKLKLIPVIATIIQGMSIMFSFQMIVYRNLKGIQPFIQSYNFILANIKGTLFLGLIGIAWYIAFILIIGISRAVNIPDQFIRHILFSIFKLFALSYLGMIFINIEYRKSVEMNIRPIIKLPKM